MTHYSKIKDKPETHLATHRLPTESDHPEEMPEPQRSPSLLPKSAMEGPSSPSSPSTPLEVLGLSAHPYNALMRSGITTVEQLAAMSHWELLDVPNIGYTLLEIWDRLKAYPAECSLRPQAEPLSGGPQSPVSAEHGPFEESASLRQSSSFETKPTCGLAPSSPSIPLEVLDLSARSCFYLKRHGITTAEQLVALSDSEILNIPGISHNSLAEAKENLRVYLATHPLPTRVGRSEGESKSSLSAQETLVIATEESASHRPPALQQNETTPIRAPSPPPSTPLEVLGLSTRPRNALRRSNIDSVDQLAALSDQEILDIRNIGFSSLIEIRDRLGAYLAARALPTETTPSEEEVKPPLSSALPETASTRAFLPLSSSTPLEMLGLSTRPHNALVRSGITTVEQLATMSDGEIMKVRNIGTKSLTEIEDRLKAYLAVHVWPTETMTAEEKPKPLSPSPPLADPELLDSAREKTIPLDKISVKRLALPVSLQSSMTWVTTIIGLAQQPRDMWERNEEITRRLDCYLTWLIKQDEADWADEVASRDISPLHRLELVETSLEDLMKKLLASLESRERQVMRWRYGLDGEELTLEEAAERLHLTSERVRQLQNQALRVLRHPKCRDIIRPLRALLVYLLEQAGGLMNEAQLEAALQQEMVIGSVNPIDAARLILELDANVKWLRKTRVWGLRSCPLGQLKNVQAQLSQVLQEEFAPLPVHEVVTRFRSTSFYRDHSDELTDTFVVACLKVHPGIEIDDDVGLCALTKWTGKSLPEIVRVLRELGESAHYTVIAEKTNALLESEMQPSAHNIHAHMQRLPDIFVRVGHGIYGLAEWGLHNDGSLANAAYRILREAARPLHIDVLTDEVLKTWRAQPGSVCAAVENDARFNRIGSGVYYLREQISSEEATQPQADFGDLFGARLERWQKDWDRRQGNVELDTQAEVDTIRRIGLDFFSD